MLSVFYGLITKNNNMELKDLEEMFKMEQELDIPHRDRWYNKDFDKRELEAEQPVKNCNIPHVSDTVCDNYDPEIGFPTGNGKCKNCGKYHEE